MDGKVLVMPCRVLGPFLPMQGAGAFAQASSVLVDAISGCLRAAVVRAAQPEAGRPEMLGDRRPSCQCRGQPFLPMQGARA